MPCRNIANLTAAIMTVFLILSCGSREEKRMKFYNRGEALFNSGEYIKAKLEFKNALQIDPRYADPYHMLGLIALKEKNIKAGFTSFLKAVELNPGLLDSHIELGKIFLIIGERDKSKEKIDLVLSKDPEHTDARLLYASWLIRDKSLIEAQNILIDIVSRYPDRADPCLLLAGLYRQQNQDEKAVEILRSLLEKDDSVTAANILISKIYEDNDKPDMAEQEYKALVKKNPDKSQFELILAEFYDRTGKKDKTEETLYRIIENNQDEIKWRLDLANYYSRNRRHTEMIKVLEQTIADFPSEIAPVSMLAAYNALKGNGETAIKILDSFINRVTEGPDFLSAMGTKARLLYNMKKPDEALKLADEVLDVNPGDIAAKNLKGDILAINKDYSGAVGFYRDVLYEERENYKIRLKLARVHLLNKEPELAEEQYKKLVEAKPDLKEAYYGLLDVYRMRGKLDLAEETLKDMNVKFPEDDSVKLLLGDFYYAKRDTDSAGENYEKLLEKHPDSPLALYKNGLTRLAQKNENEAVALFEKALEKNPSFDQALKAILNIMIRNNRVDRAIKRCEDQVSKVPDNPVYLILLGRAHGIRKEYDTARKYLNRALDLDSQNIDALYNLARLEEASGSINAAIERYREISGKRPDDIRLKMTLAGLLSRERKMQESKALYEEILEKNPGMPLAANNLAYYYVEHEPTKANIDKAVKIITPVLERYKDTPNIVDTAAWVFFNHGEIEKAKNLLVSIESRGEEFPEINYHLALIYNRLKNKEMAKNYLRKVLDNPRKIEKIEEARKLYDRLSDA